MVDLFKECPYILLGLPLFADAAEINLKWKELMLMNHPDKHNGSDMRSVHTQALNCAKDRALQEFGSIPAAYARLNTPVEDAERAEEYRRAEAKRVLYETLWAEQERAGGQADKNNAVEKARMDEVRAANDAAERVRMEEVRVANDAAEKALMAEMLAANNAAERERMEEVRAANDAAEEVRMAGLRAAGMGADRAAERAVKKPKREHKQVWNTEECTRSATLVREFVQEKTEAGSEVFTCTQQFLTEFRRLHPTEEVDANFFRKKFKEAVEEVYPDVRSLRRTSGKGYLGIRVRK